MCVDVVTGYMYSELVVVMMDHARGLRSLENRLLLPSLSFNWQWARHGYARAVSYALCLKRHLLPCRFLSSVALSSIRHLDCEISAIL